jgi:hypothetical protein
MESLKESPGMSKEVRVRVENAYDTVKLVEPLFPGVKALNSQHFILNLPDDVMVSEVNRKLVEMNIPVEGIEVKKGLEEWFMNITR